MESFTLKKVNSSKLYLFQPQRKTKTVVATPEELVRQKVLLFLTQKLGFPPSSITTEKGLSQFLSSSSARLFSPKRRVDLVCFAPLPKKEKSLSPLLLLECKAENLTEEAARQALGYNQIVQAPFVGLANESEIRLIYPYSLVFLPHYEQLLKEASS